jgi:hypothetical protein
VLQRAGISTSTISPGGVARGEQVHDLVALGAPV